ncbi:hypothetical protein F2P81_025793 [Scophthalmus maximus]|uniref:Uncharacterized protein n=1 Tax=Scophthalmus maximus TaxID=52904 RepID=A0A6A4RTR7_SCOMX|nr:hypothetical protein F2P81_025793 [Scophthalmus maximus]
MLLPPSPWSICDAAVTQVGALIRSVWAKNRTGRQYGKVHPGKDLTGFGMKRLHRPHYSHFKAPSRYGHNNNTIKTVI